MLSKNICKEQKKVIEELETKNKELIKKKGEEECIEESIIEFKKNIKRIIKEYQIKETQ